MKVFTSDILAIPVASPFLCISPPTRLYCLPLVSKIAPRSEHHLTSNCFGVPDRTDATSRMLTYLLPLIL
jgi:hypothetical protein